MKNVGDPGPTIDRKLGLAVLAVFLFCCSSQWWFPYVFMVPNERRARETVRKIYPLVMQGRYDEIERRGLATEYGIEK